MVLVRLIAQNCFFSLYQAYPAGLAVPISCVYSSLFLMLRAFRLHHD